MFSAMDQDIAFELGGSISHWFLPEFLAQNQQPAPHLLWFSFVLFHLSWPQTTRTTTCAQSAHSGATYWLIDLSRRNSGLRQLFISLNLGYNAD